MKNPNDGGNVYPHQKDTVRDGLTKREAITIAVRQAIGTWTPDFVPPYNASGIPFDSETPEYQAAARQARAAWCVAEADAILAELNKE